MEKKRIVPNLRNDGTFDIKSSGIKKFDWKPNEALIIADKVINAYSDKFKHDHKLCDECEGMGVHVYHGGVRMHYSMKTFLAELVNCDKCGGTGVIFIPHSD